MAIFSDFSNNTDLVFFFFEKHGFENFNNTYLQILIFGGGGGGHHDGGGYGGQIV
jgi:hypothetical protein